MASNGRLYVSLFPVYVTYAPLPASVVYKKDEVDKIALKS